MAAVEAPGAMAEDPEKAGPQTLTSSDEEGGAMLISSRRPVSGFKWFLVCVSLYISAFLYGLDTTIAADIQGPIVEQLGHVDLLAWIGAGFPLGSVAVILLVGKLFGSFNKKWVFVGSIAMFEIGTVLCGAAPNMDCMIVGRVIAGIGGSGLYLGCLNYFSQLTTPDERGRYISLIGLCWGTGALLGPVVGGAFSVSSGATWRWSFYINLVISAVFAPVYLLFLPSLHPVDGKSVRRRLASFDVVGLALIVGVWVTFTVVFTMAGGPWAWNDGRTIALLVVFGVLLVATVLQQYFAVFTTLEARAFPGHVLKSRTQILLFIGTGAGTGCQFIFIYYIPIYFQFAHSVTAIQAALRILPFIAVSFVTNLTIGHLLPRIRYYMPIYVVAGVSVTVGATLMMVNLKPQTSESAIYGYSVIIAFGTGMTIQVGYAIATLTARSEDMGHVLNFQNISQLGSTVISLVIGGQVFQSTAVANLTAVLAGQGFSAADITNAVSGAQSALFASLSDDLRTAAIAAIVAAMQKAFILNIVSGATMIIAGLCMKREPLSFH